MNTRDRRILFVDDHRLFGEGLRRALGAHLPELAIEVVSTAAEARAKLQGAVDYDLFLTDQRLGDGEGVDLIAFARRTRPDMPAGLMTGDLSRPLLRRARAAGAAACLSKERDTRSLAGAVTALLGGGVAYDSAEAAALNMLTEKRVSILRLAAEGLLDKEIGHRLGVSESAVRNHWEHIFELLGAANRTEAVSKAIRADVI